MTLEELRFVRRMVDAGTEVSRETWVKVLEHALALEQRSLLSHDEQCGRWEGFGCDCPEGQDTGEIEVGVDD